MSQSLKNKTIKGISWSFVDSISSQGISFLVGLVLARLVTPEEYGLVGILLIFVSIFDCIVNCGFTSALIRKNDAKDIDYNTAFYTNLTISIILCIVLFFSARYIADFFDQPLLISLTQVISIAIIINALSLVQRTILTKRLDFKTQAKANVASSLLSGIIGISMAFYGYGIWSLVIQYMSRSLFSTLLLWMLNRWWPKIQFSWNSFKEMFSFSWKLLVSSLIDVAWRDVYQVVIGKCYAPATLGQYTRAHQFGSIFSSNLTIIIQRVSYPVLSSIQDDKERMKDAYRRVIKVTMLITFVLMLGLAAISKPMIEVLIGTQWLVAAGFLPIICLQMMLYPLHAINLNMLQVQGRSDLFLKLEIVKKCVGLIPLLMGIFINIYWMLWGSVFAGIFAYYLNSYYSGKFLNYSMWSQVKDIFPSFAIAVCMAVAIYMISLLPFSPFILLFLQIITGACITIVLCEWIKLAEYKELKSIVLSVLQKAKHK